jgi:predicted nucleotidyltransferase
LALFGSAARDNLSADSDLDILVEFEQSTWDNYIGLKLFLEDSLGRPVDLVTPKALRPILRPSVERDLLHVVT